MRDSPAPVLPLEKKRRGSRGGRGPPPCCRRRGRGRGTAGHEMMVGGGSGTVRACWATTPRRSGVWRIQTEADKVHRRRRSRSVGDGRHYGPLGGFESGRLALVACCLCFSCFFFASLRAAAVARFVELGTGCFVELRAGASVCAGCCFMKADRHAMGTEKTLGERRPSCNGLVRSFWGMSAARVLLLFHDSAPACFCPSVAVYVLSIQTGIACLTGLGTWSLKERVLCGPYRGVGSVDGRSRYGRGG